MLKEILISNLDIVIRVIGGIILILLGKLFLYLNKKFKASDAEKDALDALLEGMSLTQENFVRAAKAISEDGKLTDDEIESAKKMAFEHAKAIAVGAGKDVLMTWSSERIGSIIKQLLAKFSKK